MTYVCALLLSLGCPSEDSESDTDGGGVTSDTSNSSPTSSSTQTSGGPSSTGGEESSGSGSGSTTGMVELPACDELCAAYEACDERVFANCQADCGQVAPALVEVDAGCGQAAIEYVACRYMLSCEDAVADAAGELVDNPCADARGEFGASCDAAAPAECVSMCEAIEQCSGAGMFDRSLCGLNCMIATGIGVLDGTAECTTAVNELISCPVESECVQMTLDCKSTQRTYEEACGVL